MKRAVLVLLAILAAYLALAIAIGRFTTTDEIAFKAAGREWARSGHFAAPELSGFAHLQPPVEQIWFAHLPAYTFLFGVFVRLLGFGAWQSVAFDALIHVALAALTFAHARRMSGSPWAAVAAAALALPLGTLGRADELATCFGMAALLMMNNPSSAFGTFSPHEGKRLPDPQVAEGRLRGALAGILLGLTAATNIIAAAFFGVLALLRVRTIRAALVLIALAVASFAACLAPILIARPDAWRQFGSHATAQFATSVGWGLAHSWIYGKPYLLSAAAALIIGLAALFVTPRVTLVRFASACAVLIVLGFVPAKSYYLWFVTPLLIAAACATAAELRERRVVQIATLLAAMLYGGAVVGPLQQQLIVATLPSSQRLAPNVAAVRAHIPPASIVRASELWSSLGNDVRYRSLVHSGTPFEEADFVVLTGNGSGAPGIPQSLEPTQQAALAEHFDVVYDNLRRDVPRLLGIPLSRSGWGYGVRIYRSRNRLMRSSGGTARSSS
jgi:hypothetical protein